jgi:hypothetical protein
MKKYIIHFITVLLIAGPVIILALTNPVSADSNQLLWDDTTDNFQATIGLSNNDSREIAAQAANVMLGFIGMIAVIIMLLGGFRWMTSAGNEDKVAEAKKIIGAGVIGLIIILAAFAIAQFVISALYNAAAANG